MESQKSGDFIRSIRLAIRDGRLSQPFTADDVRESVSGFAFRTYNNFLPKHRVGNPGGNTELFIRLKPGLYRLVND